MKKKSILKGASFFLATFAFCGVMALGAKYISPRHEVNTTIETQIAYADEATSVIDKTAWDSFKETYKNDILNVTSIVTSLSAPQTLGTINESIGTNARVDINGTVMTFYSTDGTKIFLPADCSEFFYKYAEITINDEDIESYFQKITTMDLSNFDTTNVTCMSRMFYFCHVTSLDLSGFNTSNVTNMSDMFLSCQALTSLDVSGFNTSNVTSMAAMFYGCNDLTSLDLSGFDTSKVTNIYGMFTYCRALTSLDVSGFDTSNVTNMSWMFGDCQALTSLDVSGFNTSNVTNMSAMFSSCQALTSLDVSGFDTTNVTDMGGMFSFCQALTSLDLSGFNTANVTNMSQMLYGCNQLYKLDISSFDTSNVTDMSTMFYNCNQLYKLDISSFDLSNVTNASDMFAGDHNLRKIYLPRAVSDSYNIDLPYTYHTQSWNYSGSYLNDFRYTLSDDNTKRFIVTDSVESQEAVIDRTEWDKFKNDNFNSDIKKIVTKKAYDPYNYTRSLGENVYAYINGDTCEIYTRLDTKILLPEDCRNMFKGLDNVTDIDLSACDTSDVTNMDSMFELCSALENVNLSGFDTSKVINMAEMFCDCGNLKEVDISNFITSQVTDIHGMFYGCNSLKVVDLSSFDLTNVNTNKLFDGCENLSMIYLPKALPQGYDVEFGSDFVLASNHAVKGSTLNAFAGYESTAGQKNAIVKGGEVNVVVDTQFADVISTGEEIEYYYGDEIVVNGTTLIIGGVSVQVVPNEVEGYEITFAGWEGIENGVVIGDTITAILTKTPINYTITMIVNGQNNTRTYNIETNTFTLEEPEGGEEEEFVGWTWEGQEVPVKDLEILKGSIGDRTVKANFAPKTYTITINVDGEITTIDYTKGSDDIVIKDPSSSGLIFDGWVDENGNKVDENVIKSGSTGDRYFKATWKKSPMLKYVAIGVLAFVGVAVATEIIVGVLVKKKKK